MSAGYTPGSRQEKTFDKKYGAGGSIEPLLPSLNLAQKQSLGRDGVAWNSVRIGRSVHSTQKPDTFRRLSGPSTGTGSVSTSGPAVRHCIARLSSAVLLTYATGTLWHLVTGHAGLALSTRTAHPTRYLRTRMALGGVSGVHRMVLG